VFFSHYPLHSCQANEFQLIAGSKNGLVRCLVMIHQSQGSGVQIQRLLQKLSYLPDGLSSNPRFQAVYAVSDPYRLCAFAP
jgi:hypothetical protein